MENSFVDSQVVLISQLPLPYSKTGSWTTLYNNYLEKDHKIDYLVCPTSKEKYDSVEYNFVSFTFFQKMQSKIFKKKKLEYINVLKKIIRPDKKYIIQIVDNYGMVKPVHDYLTSKQIRENFYIQFFYHGFSPYSNINSGKYFYELVNEIIVLTHDSYKEFRKIINVLPCYFYVLHNGIDTTKFRKISDVDKKTLREKLELKDEKIFIWCSQDRPKKGLHVILEAWKKVYELKQNIILFVIGCERTENIEGVRFIGKVPNQDLPQYLQAADCYLFPTLCHEGFGLSLVEALHCGNYCIASALGGVPEVMQYGKLGKLIENPHFVSEWKDAINDFLNGKFEMPELQPQLYSMESWNDEMNKIIMNAKNRLKNN